MRIRKRKSQFPLSSLPPMPLSTTDLSTTTTTSSRPHHVVVQLQEEDDTDAYFNNPQPSDHHHLHQINGQDSSSFDHRHHPPTSLVNKNFLQGEEKGREREKSNDTRTASLFGAAGESHVVLDHQESKFSANQGVLKGGDEGEEEVPLRRRRTGSFKNRVMNDNETLGMADQKDNKKNKLKTNYTKSTSKKSQRLNDVGQEEEDEEKEEEEEEAGDDNDDREEDKKVILETSKEGIFKNAVGGSNSTSGAKKRGARGGATLMEGSRCSRVNGRGWRCFQQTLVGYSLCEHHLGKGRLRSMSSVRNRTVKVDNHKDKKAGGGGEDGDQDIVEDNKDAVMVNLKKRKMKLGMNKARSINSLLGEANNEDIGAFEEDD